MLGDERYFFMKTNYKEYLRRLLGIAVPIMLSNIIGQLQMLIDRIFLGRANDLYMSALSNATSPMWTTMSFCFALVAGASILISQRVGANDRDNIEEYAGAWNKRSRDWNGNSGIFGSSIYLLISGINLISKSANIIIGNGIRGSGDTKWMLYTLIFGTICIICVLVGFKSIIC